MPGGARRRKFAKGHWARAGGAHGVVCVSSACAGVVSFAGAGAARSLRTTGRGGGGPVVGTVAGVVVAGAPS